MDNWLRIYAWFLLAVTALPALARLARPRELAQIMLARYQNPKRRKRARIGGVMYLGTGVAGRAVSVAFSLASATMADHGAAGGSRVCRGVHLE